LVTDLRWVPHSKIDWPTDLGRYITLILSHSRRVAIVSLQLAVGKQTRLRSSQKVVFGGGVGGKMPVTVSRCLAKLVLDVR
jgi:hypothetical protein